MTRNLLAALIVGGCIVSSSWWLARSITRPPQPIATYPFRAMFYESSGIDIQVPDPDRTVVEIYESFVLVKRPDGVWTVVPISRLHALDLKGQTADQSEVPRAIAKSRQ